MWGPPQRIPLCHVFFGEYIFRGNYLRSLWMSRGRPSQIPFLLQFLLVSQSQPTLSLLVASQWGLYRTRYFFSTRSNFRFPRKLAIVSKFSTFVPCAEGIYKTGSLVLKTQSKYSPFTPVTSYIEAIHVDEIHLYNTCNQNFHLTEQTDLRVIGVRTQCNLP